MRLENTDSPIDRMQTMLAGHFVSQCLHVAAVLGLADLIAQGNETVEQIAQATGCHQPSLNRLLTTLASLDVFTRDAMGRLRLTSLGDTLRSDVQVSLRDKALFEISEPVWRAWGSCLASVRTGRPSFHQVYDATLWQYLAQHSEIAAIFNRFMTAQSKLHNTALLESYDFSGIGTLIDVGGGYGSTLAAVLAQYPDMRGILFDLPEVVASAEKLETSRFSDRCDVVGGDMLSSIPPQGDAYIIKRVMMDLTDDKVARVLENCIAVMGSRSKILVIDPLIPEGTTPHPNRLVDLLMMNVSGGRCRTEEQFRELFQESGLMLSRVIATPSPNSILEGRRL
jgi:hypothetical protein